MFVQRRSLVWLQVLLFCATVYAREFSNGGTYSMSDPGSVALADFNDDGRLDMVTGGNGTVTIRLGKGDGSFSRRSFYSNSTSGTSIVTADFNGDGNKDIVVAGNEPDVNVLLGNGDGTFQIPIYVSNVGPYTSDVAVGDFNQDGMIDLAISNSKGGGPLKGSVAIALGLGNGQFQAATLYPAGLSPNSLAVGDVNGDGILDVVAGTAGNGVAVLLGKGNGSFGSAISSRIGISPSHVLLTDINNDGKLDLVATLLASDGKANKVVVAIGTGDGRFRSPILVALSDDLAGTAAADFDGDGFLDLAITKSTSGAGMVEVFFGDGDGTFGSPEKYSTPVRQPIAAAVGDLNGDAQSDVIFVNDSLSIGILINSGN